MDFLGFDVLQVAVAAVVFSVVCGFLYAPAGRKADAIKCFALGYASILVTVFVCLFVVSLLPFSLFENFIIRKLLFFLLVLTNFLSLLFFPVFFLERSGFEIRLDSYAKAMAPWLLAIFAIVFLMPKSLW